METVSYPRRFPVPVKRTVLENGLTVFTAETDSQLILGQLVFDVGAMEDDAESLGAAHFLEHGVMKGAAQDGVHPKLRSLYLRGVKGNAATSFYYTEYWLEGLREDGPEMLKTLLSICFEPEFTPEQIERERAVILQEHAQFEKSARSRIWQRRLKFPGVPRLHATVDGNPESISAMQSAHLHAFHGKWYKPSRAALVVAGGMTHEEVLELARKALAGHAAEQRIAARQAFFPRYERGRYVGEEIATSALHLYYPSPTDCRESVQLGYVADVLGFTRLGLLQEKLRGQDRSIYNLGVNVESWPFPKFSVDIPAREELFPYLEQEVATAVDRVIAGDYSEELFTAIKIENRIALATRVEERTRGGWADTLEELWLSGDLEDLDEPSLIMDVTREDVSNAARKFLKGESGRLVFLPDEAGQGGEEAVRMTQEITV